jgi:hypothetical protein
MKHLNSKAILLLVIWWLLSTEIFAITIDPGNHGKDTIISKGDKITLGGSPTVKGGKEPYKYQWEADKGGFSSENTNPEVEPEETTVYSVTITDADDFKCSASIKVIVCSEPEKVKLGIKKTMHAKSCFKVFIPTRWGGQLKITTSNGTITRLKDPDKADFKNNTETNKVGWYTFRVFDSDNYEVTAEFTQTGEASKRPWNFYWWSCGASKPTLYSRSGKYTPLSKYDARFGTTARDWEEANHSSTVGWEGHCLGAACASILLNQPTAIPTFPARNDELEGLWAELGEETGIQNIPDGYGDCPAGPPISGSDGTDTYAGKFHKMMEQYIKGLGKALQSNLRSEGGGSEEVWNHAVWKYTAKFEEAPGDNENKVKIAITVYANADHTPPTDDANNRVINYVYIIEYSGGVVDDLSSSQDWISVSGQAKYAPSNLLYLTGVNWGGINTSVTESNVRLIDSAN